MKLKDFRQVTKHLPDNFELEVKINKPDPNSPFNFEHKVVKDQDIDIAHSDMKVVICVETDNENTVIAEGWLAKDEGGDYYTCGKPNGADCIGDLEYLQNYLEKSELKTKEEIDTFISKHIIEPPIAVKIQMMENGQVKEV